MSILATVSAITSGIQAISSAKQQEEQNERAAENYQKLVENIYQGTNLDLDMLEMQQGQTEDAANERIYQRNLQALKDRSRIMVTTGEANVGGPTVDRLLGHYEMDAAHDIQIQKRNKEMQLQQSAMKGRSMIRDAQSAMNQGERRRQSQTTENPWLNTGLRALPSAYGAYKNYQATR